MNILSRQPEISGEDRGPLVNILAIVLFIVAFFAVVARIVTKYFVSRTLGWDDTAISGALIFHAGEVATVFVAGSNGLGQHSNALSAEQVNTFSKAIYAAELLFILVVAISKISVPVFLHHLTPRQGHQQTAKAIISLIVAWSLASFVASAAQCSSTIAWRITDDRCFQQYAFWLTYDVINIITEVAVILLAVLILRKVHINNQRKGIIIGCFASRVLVIIAAICQAIFHSKSQSDLEFTDWPTILCSVFVASFSIISACVPYIKSFYLNLESGMIRTDDIRRRQSVTGTYKRQYDKYPSRSRTSDRQRSASTGLMQQSPPSATIHYDWVCDPETGMATLREAYESR